jgi:hypothetical protein
MIPLVFLRLLFFILTTGWWSRRLRMGEFNRGKSGMGSPTPTKKFNLCFLSFSWRSFFLGLLI